MSGERAGLLAGEFRAFLWKFDPLRVLALGALENAGAPKRALEALEGEMLAAVMMAGAGEDGFTSEDMLRCLGWPSNPQTRRRIRAVLRMMPTKPRWTYDMETGRKHLHYYYTPRPDPTKKRGPGRPPRGTLPDPIEKMYHEIVARAEGRSHPPPRRGRPPLTFFESDAYARYVEALGRKLRESNIEIPQDRFPGIALGIPLRAAYHAKRARSQWGRPSGNREFRSK